MSDRNLNPSPEAVIAMNFYSGVYGAQNGGSMDFWDSLPADRKAFCKMLADRVIEAHKRSPESTKKHNLYERVTPTPI